MCKEGWWVGLGQEKGVEQGRGGETKILKKRKAESKGGCLKKGGGLEPPYELCVCKCFVNVLNAGISGI